MKALWPALAVAITCSGCFGATPTAKPTSSPPTSSTVPSPSGTEMVALTKAQAARSYLRIVHPYNAALERFESEAHAGRSWTSLRALAKRVSAANTAQVRELRSAPWPVDARKHVSALLAVSAQAGRYWNAAAKATGPQQFQMAVLRAAKLSGEREATALRHALGLPPYRES